MFGLAVLAASRATAVADPSGARALAAGDLGWPTTTIAAAARARVTVVDAPEGRRRLAVVAPGTRVTWRRIVAGEGSCPAWLELEPSGWACAKDLRPLDQPASATTAPTPPSPTRPATPRWADVRKAGADAYETIADIQAGTIARHVDDRTYVALRARVAPRRIDGKTYVQTDQGWVASSDLSWYSPSPFAGLELTPTSSLEIGWAVARKPGGKIAVYASAEPTAAKVRVLSPRDRVSILEARGERVRIGADEWVDRAELRKPPRVPRPSGVAPDERWLDVDLTEQTLVAYEGDAPVFTTVISSGRIYWETPTGIYRIMGKEPRTRMQYQGKPSADPDVPSTDPRAGEAWNVADVPFSMRFRKNFALHGTYWHDGFGRARSHGCVNLSTADAQRIYDWVTPLAPPGWSGVESDGHGTPVRIHSRRDPDPVWRDYDGKLITPAPTI